MPITITVYAMGELAGPVEFENAIWKLSDRPNATDNKKTDLFVECIPIDDSANWEVDAVLKFKYGEIKTTLKETLKAGKNKVFIISAIMDKYDFLLPIDIHVGLTIEAKMKYLNQTNLGNEFLNATPNMSDAKLIVDGREILAQSSPYFYDLFYKTHVGQDKFAIDDVSPEDFTIFLAFLYNRKLHVSHELYETLAKLSKRFEVKECLKKCEKILIKFRSMSDDEKLFRAKGFGFNVLHDCVLKKLRTIKKVSSLGKSPNKFAFGENTKAKIINRINELQHWQKPYYEQIVTLSKDKSEQIVQLDAIPCKIIENGNKVTIECNWPHISSPWQCEILVSPSNISAEEAMKYDFDNFNYLMTERFCFDWMNPIGVHRTTSDEIRLTVVYLVGIFPERCLDFNSPRDNLTDVVLAVGDKKFHVSKQILAEASSYFYSLFFSEFAEKNKQEIQLFNTDADDFEELLQHVYFPDRDVSSETIGGLIELAQMYDVPQILTKCEKVLPFDNTLDDVMKLYLSETYNFPEVFKTLASKIKTFKHLRNLSKQDGFEQLSKNGVADITIALLNAESETESESDSDEA